MGYMGLYWVMESQWKSIGPQGTPLLSSSQRQMLHTTIHHRIYIFFYIYIFNRQLTFSFLFLVITNTQTFTTPRQTYTDTFAVLGDQDYNPKQTAVVCTGADNKWRWIGGSVVLCLRNSWCRDRPHQQISIGSAALHGDPNLSADCYLHLLPH